MTWLLATLFTVAAYPVDQPITKHKQIKQFYDLVNDVTTFNLKLCIQVAGGPLGSLDDIRVPPTSAVKDFHRKVENSAHTCWDDYDPGWYAAAIACLANGSEEDIEFVPLLQPECKQCDLTCAAHTFARKATGSSLSLSSSKEAVEDLLHTVVSIM